MDISKYKTVSEWYAAEHMYHPIQAPAALCRVMKEKNMTFHEAWDYLVEIGAIILIDEE